MINSVSPSSPVNQAYLAQQQQHNVAAHKTKAAEQAKEQDSVVLSKQAQAAVDADHDGD